MTRRALAETAFPKSNPPEFLPTKDRPELEPLSSHSSDHLYQRQVHGDDAVSIQATNIAIIEHIARLADTMAAMQTRLNDIKKGHHTHKAPPINREPTPPYHKTTQPDLYIPQPQIPIQQLYQVNSGFMKTVLVKIKSDDDFNAWKMNLEAVLMAEGMMEYIQSDTPNPQKPFNVWARENAMVYTVMLQSVMDITNRLSSVGWDDSARSPY
jgi:hypothetical protein